MKKFFYITILSLFTGADVIAQNVEAQIVVDNASTPTNTIVNFRVRTVVGTQNYVGISMYFVYQQANLAPQSTGNNTVVGVNDVLLTTTYGWGTSQRTTTPFQLFGPIVYDGQSYDRRYVYINVDETGGANMQVLTTTWVTLYSITFNNLQPAYPQGGFGYLQETSEFINASITNEFGVNVPINVTTGSVPLGPPVVAPVLFTNFDVKCNDKGALLTWATATEQNTDRFEIQRSSNAIDWVTIDNVTAAGTSTAQRNYQYLDLYGGNTFYRIRQVDKDGRFIYTAVKTTNCKTGQFDVVLYPVPAKDKLTVVIKSDQSAKTDLQVFDMNGKLVRSITTQINKGNNNIILDVNGLPGGQYMLISREPSVAFSKKFTVIQ